jgi:UDP-N-acetylglucosamine/UDP-N-acetylgalactosamine diphosphorylase
MVGPLRVGYGNIIAAGTILRKDIDEENKLVFGKGMSGEIKDRNPNSYPSISRIVGNNIIYLANLVALEQWYTHVRQPFFKKQEFGDLVYAGAMDNLSLIKKERIKRLQVMADKAKTSIEKYPDRKESEAGKKELYAAVETIRELFSKSPASGLGVKLRDGFIATVNSHIQSGGQKYIDFIKGLSADTSEAGVIWLKAIVDSLCAEAQGLMPSLELYKK